MKNLLIALLALMTVACAQAPKEQFSQEYLNELPLLRAYVLELRPSLASMEGLELAIELRDVVHQSVSFHRSTDLERFNPNRPFENFRLVIEDRANYGHYCWGAAKTYADVLRAFGFQANMIQTIAAEGKDATHVTNEVFIGGRFIAQDPTFNIQFRGSNGQLLNYSEMQALTKQGGHVADFEFGSYELQRDVYAYPVPYFEHLATMFVIGL